MAGASVHNGWVSRDRELRLFFPPLRFLGGHWPQRSDKDRTNEFGQVQHGSVSMNVILVQLQDAAEVRVQLPTFGIRRARFELVIPG